MKIRANLFFSFVVIFLCMVQVNIFSMDDRKGKRAVVEEVASEAGTSSAAASSESLSIEKLNTMTIQEWLSRTTVYEDFKFLANIFLNSMTRSFQEVAWLKPPNVAAFFPKASFAYLSKLFVPNGTITTVIGDIHANMRTVEILLNALKRRSIINEKMQVLQKNRLIFLGDYADRGGQTFKTLSTILLLAIKNKKRVFPLRGNHELVQTNEMYGIADELRTIGCPTDKIKQMYTVLGKIYKCFSVGMFLGYPTSKDVRYLFFTHGSLDVRYNYTDFLRFHIAGFDEHKGELSFWRLADEDKTREFIDRIKAIQGDTSDTQILDQFLREAPMEGFTMIDTNFIGGKLVAAGTRGPGSLVQSPRLMQQIAGLYNCPDYSLDGIIHGHTHSLPREFDKKASRSGCCIFLDSPVVKDAWDVTVIPGGDFVKFNNRFSVTTLISGPITEGGSSLNYAEMFLVVAFSEEKSQWYFKALTN